MSVSRAKRRQLSEKWDGNTATKNEIFAQFPFRKNGINFGHCRDNL